jgi:hypothetical protein
LNAVARKLLIWFYSLIAAAAGGIGTSVGAFIGGQVSGAVSFTPRQLAAVAISGAIFSAAMYLAKSPLPKIEDGDL